MKVKMFNRGGQSAGKTSNSFLISKEIGWYLSGFADGEGSFNLSIIKRKDYSLPWKASLAFNISQKDNTIPFLFLKTLKCGKIRYRKDGICYYEVRNIQDINNKIIPFFNLFQFKSKEKQIKFKIFCEMTKIITKKEHLNKKGIIKLLNLRSKMIVGRKRKYSNNQIIDMI